jgi:hypothetical protein
VNGVSVWCLAISFKNTPKILQNVRYLLSGMVGSKAALKEGGGCGLCICTR